WDATTGHCLATFGIGEPAHVTDAGTFDLSVPSPSPSPTTALSASDPLCHPLQRQGYGISADGVWITYQGRNLLWLPSVYRPVTSAITASTIALGCNSGRVLLFRFSGEAPR
ncbi:hypothetical protein EDB80DRAFT_593047, partial [Ilyonectria destructans]